MAARSAAELVELTAAALAAETVAPLAALTALQKAGWLAVMWESH
jgi:hypothetical protein